MNVERKSTTADPALARRMLARARLAVLATAGRRGPHASLVAVLPGPEAGTLVFATPRDTLKHRNLAADPRAAMLLSAGTERGRSPALTVAGRVRELRGRQAGLWLDRLQRAHPDLGDIAGRDECTVFLLRPRALTLADGARPARRLAAPR